MWSTLMQSVLYVWSFLTNKLTIRDRFNLINLCDAFYIMSRRLMLKIKQNTKQEGVK